MLIYNNLFIIFSCIQNYFFYFFLTNLYFLELAIGLMSKILMSLTEQLIRKLNIRLFSKNWLSSYAFF